MARRRWRVRAQNAYQWKAIRRDSRRRTSVRRAANGRNRRSTAWRNFAVLRNDCRYAPPRTIRQMEINKRTYAQSGDSMHLAKMERSSLYVKYLQAHSTGDWWWLEHDYKCKRTNRRYLLQHRHWNSHVPRSGCRTSTPKTAAMQKQGVTLKSSGNGTRPTTAAVATTACACLLERHTAVFTPLDLRK